MAVIQINDLEPIASTKAKINFGDVLHQASVNGKRFVVNRQGKAVAVILSYNEYCNLVESNNGEDEK